MTQRVLLLLSMWHVVCTSSTIISCFASFYLAFTTTLYFALFYFSVLHCCVFNFLSIHDYCIILVVQYFSFLLFFSLFEQFLPWLPFFLITFHIWFSPSDNLYDTLLLSVLSNNIINRVRVSRGHGYHVLYVPTLFFDLFLPVAYTSSDPKVYGSFRFFK